MERWLRWLMTFVYVFGGLHLLTDLFELISTGRVPFSSIANLVIAAAVAALHVITTRGGARATTKEL